MEDTYQLLHSTIALWDRPGLVARIINFHPDLYEKVEETFNDCLFEYATLTGNSELLERSTVETPQAETDVNTLCVINRQIRYTPITIDYPIEDQQHWRSWVAQHKQELTRNKRFPCFDDTARVVTKAPLSFLMNREGQVGRRSLVELSNDSGLEIELLKQSTGSHGYRFLGEYNVLQMYGKEAEEYVSIPMYPYRV